ncbi:MAG TPA: hypothetical protein VHC69_28070 [Polyangiaceae bacterium]|nr:hypothetical protein [Polyangiaceae bacterium]
MLQACEAVAAAHAAGIVHTKQASFCGHSKMNVSASTIDLLSWLQAGAPND